MELKGKDLSCCLNNILYDHSLSIKAYFSDIIVKNIYQSLTHKMAAKASWHRNYVTVTVCICVGAQ